MTLFFLHKEHPTPKLYKDGQYLDKQIEGLFSTLLTINDNLLRAKAEIASTIIKFFRGGITNLSYNDILKYQQEFQNNVISKLKPLRHSLDTIKFKHGKKCLNINSKYFNTRRLTPKKNVTHALFKEATS